MSGPGDLRAVPATSSEVKRRFLGAEVDFVCGQQTTAETSSVTDAVGTTLLLEVTLWNGVCKAVGSGSVTAVRLCSPDTWTLVRTTCDLCGAPGSSSTAVA